MHICQEDGTGSVLVRSPGRREAQRPRACHPAAGGLRQGWLGRVRGTLRALMILQQIVGRVPQSRQQAGACPPFFSAGTCILGARSRGVGRRGGEGPQLQSEQS